MTDCRVIEIIKTIPDLCYVGEVWTECFDDPGVFYTETPTGNYLHFQFVGFGNLDFEKEKVVKFLDPVKKEETEHFKKKKESNQKRIEELQSEINRLQEIIETLKKEI
jgi:hypothetical protein